MEKQTFKSWGQVFKMFREWINYLSNRRRKYISGSKWFTPILGSTSLHLSEKYFPTNLNEIMARKHDLNSVQRRQILLPYSKNKSKQIQDGNVLPSNGVKSVRDLFIFSEKHCEEKSFGKMEAWINDEGRKSKRIKRGFQHSGNFPRSLRAEASSEVTYKLVASPEFKPGNYFFVARKSVWFWLQCGAY